MSDAMDSDVREVIRRRIEVRESHGHDRLLLNHEALRALLDAADERDRLAEVESRLSVLLWRLTNGRLSKTSYPVEFMEQEIEENLARYHESDMRDERDRLAAAVERVRALAEWHETKAMKARRFRPEIDGENRVMDKTAEVHDDAARRVRRALDGPEDLTS